ncbi:putative inhibitor of prohead protease [Klebsiella phage vB_KpnM-VAC36]|nr:putative inhibitor of prohead protease [Klebsiella phage vB_KpnM-VAC36]
MDKQYIDDLRGLENKKEAKAKLIEYAEGFNIQLKKSKGFENLVLDIETAFKKMAEEPMPEDNEGLSISDLIAADDELEGKNDFVLGDVEAKPEAKLLFDSPEIPVSIHEIKEPVQKQSVVEEKAIHIESPIGKFDTPQPKLSENTFEEAVAKIISDETTFELPENFSPHFILMGRNPGYTTLPWWIYEWIKDNPDWKSRPTSFPHPSAHQTLFSLIYYIKRNGSIMIRETRNSSFVTLK